MVSKKPNINYNTLNLNTRTLTYSNTEQSACCHVRPSEERHDLSHTIMSTGLSKSTAVLSYKSCGIQQDMTVTYTYTYCLLYKTYTKYRVGHEKVACLPFCTCPCDILSGVSMYIA